MDRHSPDALLRLLRFDQLPSRRLILRGIFGGALTLCGIVALGPGDTESKKRKKKKKKGGSNPTNQCAPMVAPFQCTVDQTKAAATCAAQDGFNSGMPYVCGGHPSLDYALWSGNPLTELRANCIATYDWSSCFDSAAECCTMSEDQLRGIAQNVGCPLQPCTHGGGEPGDPLRL